MGKFLGLTNNAHDTECFAFGGSLQKLLMLIMLTRAASNDPHWFS